MENNKVNKTTKLWSVDPGTLEDKKLLATFELKDGKLVGSSMPSDNIKGLATKGYYVDGARVTLKSDAVQFVELLEMNHATSTYTFVEVIED